MNGVTILGLFASVLTAVSYWPQLTKALPRGSTKDLSLKMLAVLTSGLVCWVAYGAVQKDWIIVVSNAVGATLSATTLACKLRDMRG